MPAFSRTRWTHDTTALGTVSLTLRRRVSSAATPSMASKTTSRRCARYCARLSNMPSISMCSGVNVRNISA
jgi:hypothetical protein